MYPFFIDGDVLEISQLRFEKIDLNDFITFKQRKKLVTHRVIYKTKKYLITKGDHNPYPDGKITPEKIIGKVSLVKRNNKDIKLNNIYFYQSSLYFSEIIKVKSVLSKYKIDFVFLKGLPLHLYFEKNIPKRIYADCDILIRRDDLAKVLKVLKRLGYEKADYTLSKTLKKIQNKEPEISLKKKIHGMGVIFDVHLEAVFLMTKLGNLDALYPQKLIDDFTNQLLESKRLIKINGEVFPILSQTNLIIYLALHLFHHNFRGYFRYEFLKNILQSKKVDYSEIYEETKLYKFQNFIYPVFFILKKYYIPDLPSKFLNQIKPGKKIMNFLGENILSINIFEDEPRIKSGTERFKNIFFLSPEPITKKILIFTNLQVVYSLFFVLQKKLMSFFLRLNFAQKKFSKFL